MRKSNEYTKLLRLHQVLQRIPISKSSWWEGVKNGKFPRPIKFGSRTSLWREDEIEELIDKFCKKNKK